MTVERNRTRPKVSRFGALLTFALLLGTPPSEAEGTDDSLIPYAVHILRTPTQSWPGYGVYLGRGLILTAAHVVDHVAKTKPRIAIAGKELPSRAVKEGALETIDLTLLQVDDEMLPVSLRIRRMTLCAEAPWPGEQVIVAIPEGTARSRIVSPAVLPPEARLFDTAIRDVATTGNSGSGVFDAGQKCLLGIMSRKIQQSVFRNVNGVWRLEREDVAKYFVPAAAIKAFMPAGLGFREDSN